MGFTALFGFVFVDIKGFPHSHYLPEGRNVGDIAIVHGGVTRNVAENLANINRKAVFVTMLEDGAIGADVRNRLEQHGVDMSYAVSTPNGNGMWLAVFDEKGNLAGSISRQPDCSAMETLVDNVGDEIIRACENVVLEIDMNAEIAEKIFALAEKYQKDVYVIVANMSVILKRPDFLPRARLFIMNEIEAGSLFQCELNKHDPESVLETVRGEAKKRHIREIVVTLGECGAVYYDVGNDAYGCIPAEKADLVDSTGAGDAFFSGAIAARMRGYSLKVAALKGAHLASMTIQTEESTCPQIQNFFNE